MIGRTPPSPTPYTNIGGNFSVTFVLDLQETHDNESLTVNVFELRVNSNVIGWTREAISINDSTPLTLTALGNNGNQKWLFTDRRITTPVVFWDHPIRS